MRLLAAILALATGQSVVAVNSTTNCVSAYASPLGVTPYRTSIEFQVQYDPGLVFIGGSQRVVTYPGQLVNLSDGGTFVDGGPSYAVGENISATTPMSKNLPTARASSVFWCIKPSGAQDGTPDGGWVAISEMTGR